METSKAKERERQKSPRFQAVRKAYRRSERALALKRQAQFGISVEAQAELLAEQGNACGVCRGPLLPGFRTHLDHDHVTGRVRGFLCRACNVGLGCFGESAATLRAALAYLEKHRPTLIIVPQETGT